MRQSKIDKVILSLTLVLTTAACVTTKQSTTSRQYGTYYDNVAALGFFKRKFVLNPDNTFTYRFRGDLMYDTSAGTFFLIKDTVFFRFHYNNYDSIYQAYKTLNKPVPIDIALSDNSSHLRPKKLLWEGDKMFYFHSQTGKLVKTGIENGKKVEIYLGLIK